MFERGKTVVVVMMAMVAMIAASCADSEVSPSYMGNTNWLTSCDEDDDCSDGLSCECRVCTSTCNTSADCSELSAVCDSGSGALVSACGSSLAESLCLPECEDDGDCGGGQCIDAHCLPAAMSSSADGGGDGDGDGDGDTVQNPTGCGAIGAFVSANLEPDGDCNLASYNPSIPIGAYDVSEGFNGSDGTCDAPYMMHLLVYSCLRGVDDTLQLDTAEVLLMDSAGNRLSFDREPDNILPNPFLVTTNATIFRTSENDPSAGVGSVETIPSNYARQLDRLAREDQKVLAEVTLSGATLGGRDVELKPFRYPILLCDGCLTTCGGLYPPEVTEEEIYGENVCIDQASADGRICVDWTCAGTQ